jgi:hypothetical protein
MIGAAVGRSGRLASSQWRCQHTHPDVSSTAVTLARTALLRTGGPGVDGASTWTRQTGCLLSYKADREAGHQ